jgi:hypothetical protein
VCVHVPVSAQEREKIKAAKVRAVAFADSATAHCFVIFMRRRTYFALQFSLAA